MTTQWLNDKPYEHHSRNGTKFFASRCDLREGVRVIKPNSQFFTELHFAEDMLEFGAMHRIHMDGRLNGFSGYDCVTLNIEVEKDS